jgi:toxin ParE1/3/4
VWTTTASEDLLEDYIYIARANPAAADRFVFDIDEKVRSFSHGGLTGIKRDELGTGLRSFAYRERIIVFLINDQELIVVRILHGHQDISAKNFEQEEN